MTLKVGFFFDVKISIGSPQTWIIYLNNGTAEWFKKPIMLSSC